MIFVQYNDHGGSKFTFALDIVATWENTDDNSTLITFLDGSEKKLRIPFDEFVDTIFSDENMVDEYTNVKIHNQDVEPVAGDEDLNACIDSDTTSCGFFEYLDRLLGKDRPEPLGNNAPKIGRRQHPDCRGATNEVDRC